MVSDIDRREVLKSTGIASTVAIASFAGCTGDSSSQPDLLTVIGYPEDAIQLFRDYYTDFSNDTDILIPYGVRDPDLPGQVGNEMQNILGTAPAAGGPNQQAFIDLFQDEYGETPGVFTSQSCDSAAIGILANVAAGENAGPAISDQMRNVTAPGGLEVGPSNFLEGVEAAANGERVSYSGASSSTDFDENGDIASAAFALWEFGDGATSNVGQQSSEEADPEGAGPSADMIPGSDAGREIMLGILLPETGALAFTGAAMIQAAQIPPRQVNESDLDLSVDSQFEDTGTNSQSGVSAANSLVNAGYPCLCGPASSDVTVRVCQEVLISNEVVGCSPSSTAYSVTNLEDDDYMFRTAPSDQVQGWVMAQVASERLGAKTTATLYVNNDYGQKLSERFSSVFQDRFDGEVFGQVAFNQGELSYSLVVNEAMSSN